MVLDDLNWRLICFCFCKQGLSLKRVIQIYIKSLSMFISRCEHEKCVYVQVQCSRMPCPGNWPLAPIYQDESECKVGSLYPQIQICQMGERRGTCDWQSHSFDTHRGQGSWSWKWPDVDSSISSCFLWPLCKKKPQHHSLAITRGEESSFVGGETALLLSGSHMWRPQGPGVDLEGPDSDGEEEIQSSSELLQAR